MAICKHRRKGIQVEGPPLGRPGADTDLVDPSSTVAGTQYPDEVSRALVPGKGFIPSEAGSYWQAYKQRAI